MINILIVDDSRTEASLLRHFFEAESDMQVVGIARDGKEAVEMTSRLRPDIITMDLTMPIMDGYTATKLIMSQTPTPIVVISSRLNNTLLDMTYLALEAGAVSVIPKPTDIDSKIVDKARKQIVDTIRSMAEIKVIKRRFKTPAVIETNFRQKDFKIKPGSFEIIAIGTSVGGPQTLKLLFSQLSPNFPVPIVVVQHMAKGFISGFTKWLNNNISLKVKRVEHNEVLKNGVIYFAPDNFHFVVATSNNQLVGKLIQGEPVSGFCPSITVLMQSVAKVLGPKAMGILLTGMGSDGSQGLLELKQAKGHTLIQDEKSCVVFGMAGVAQSLGAVDKVLTIDQMAEYLIKMTVTK